MKKFIGMVAVVSILAGCGKDNVYSNDFSSVNVINASPNTDDNFRSLRLFVDTSTRENVSVGFRAGSGYQAVTPGVRNLSARAISITGVVGRVVWSANNQQLNNGQGYTYLIYDTLPVPITATSTYRGVQLVDDLNLPATGQAKVRFAHLAINAPAVDVTLLRTSVTPNDSVTISNRSYLGAAPTLATIAQTATFSAIPAGTYSLRVKLAGTQTLALAPAAVTLGNQHILTFYAAGTAQGQALSANAFRHYP